MSEKNKINTPFLEIMGQLTNPSILIFTLYFDSLSLSFGLSIIIYIQQLFMRCAYINPL